MSVNVAILGATGAVGEELLRILAERRFPIRDLRLLASPRSAGQTREFAGRALRVEAVGPRSFDGVRFALFSAGSSASREWAPIAQRSGAIVIDNSSAFRMDPGVPLVVPEINPADLAARPTLVANPNCSAIILLMALAPLHRANPLRRVIVATYQSVSGAGLQAMRELEQQTRDVLAGRPAMPRVLPHVCAFNVFSHNSAVAADGYNVEETKIAEESRKILHAPELAIAATCVRVPVMRAHTQAVFLTFERPIAPEAAQQILSGAPGVRMVDDPKLNHFPMPIEASGRDEVLVGRIRRDTSDADGRGLALMISGDQLRKGAALNAVQIAEHLVRTPA